MLETFRNAWKIEDLRKRLLFTLLILVLFRLGCALPVPYISAGALTSMFAGGNGDMLEYLNMMSGGALSECTLFALGVQPYINSSIIIQLHQCLHHYAAAGGSHSVSGKPRQGR